MKKNVFHVYLQYWHGPGEDECEDNKLSSFSVLAVSECVRDRRACFILTCRKWEGPLEMGGAIWWRRNWQCWRNWGRSLQTHKCTHTHTQFFKKCTRHVIRKRVGTKVTGLIALPHPHSPVWETHAHSHTFPHKGSSNWSATCASVSCGETQFGKNISGAFIYVDVNEEREKQILPHQATTCSHSTTAIQFFLLNRPETTGSSVSFLFHQGGNDSGW